MSADAIAPGELLRPDDCHRDHTDPQNYKSARYLNLPTELRLRILCYTNLIRERSSPVEWSPDRGFFIQSTELLPGGVFPFPHCFRPKSVRRPAFLPACGCRRIRVNSSTRPCQCWLLPLSLFLVCRTMREDALLIFFSKNRFIIHPPRVTGNLTPSTSAPFHLQNHASQFLLHVLPRHFLPYLRFLEIIFVPYTFDEQDGAYRPAASHSVRIWTRLLSNLQGEFRHLTLRIAFTRSPTLALYGQEEPDAWPSPHDLSTIVVGPFTDHQKDLLSIIYRHCPWVTAPRPPPGHTARIAALKQDRIQAYMQFIEPLKILTANNALASLYVHLGLPLGSTNMTWVDTEIWEKRAEALIMGDEYNAEKMGKEEQFRGLLEDFPGALFIRRLPYERPF